MTNFAIATDRLLPEALYRDSSTYARLQQTWYDPRPVPEEAALDQAYAEWVAEQEALANLEAAHQQRQTSAKTSARNIPNWATWDEPTTVNWITTNVTDLASAKTVLLAMARLLVALRDAQWPDLGD